MDLEQGTELRLDRTAFSVGTLGDEEEEEDLYWSTKTPVERLQGLEQIRQIIYGYAATSARLQRVIEFTQRQ